MDRLIQMGKGLGYEVIRLQECVKQQQADKGQSDRRKGNMKGIGPRRKKLKQIQNRIAEQDKDREL